MNNSRSPTIDSVLASLLHLTDEAFNKRAWHGPNLRGSLRGVSANEAAWRPLGNRHNIWEIAVHAAYWKYTVRRRLLNENRGSFPLKGSNWIKRPEELTPAAWRADIRLLEDVHTSLRDAIISLPPGKLTRKPHSSKYTYFELIAGVAAHDLYHAGQIQLLKRLQKQ